MSDDADNAAKAPDVVNKWGQEVASRGFAQLPNYLLLLNQFLDDDHRLSPVELLLLFQLVGGWWKKEALPFPSIGTLARRCGVSDRQIQRALVRLEQLKFVERTKRRGKRGLIASNAYDLSPLVSVLQEIAKAFPNEFPRAVTYEQRKAISARLVEVGGAELGASATLLPGEATVEVGSVPVDTETPEPEEKPLTIKPRPRRRLPDL